MTALTIPKERQRERVCARPSSVRTARIGLLGCGTVGRELARILLHSRDRIAQAHGVRLEVSRILVRDLSRDRGLNAGLFTARFEHVLEAEPDVVIELIGGIEPAAAHIRAALERGIPVVTANKSLIARHGSALLRLAQHRGTSLAYEASVGAAMPVLASLRQLAGDQVHSIRAVINGSCNYILTRLTHAPISMNEALSEAIELGLAEPDPSADISGADSAEKLCVLAAAAGYGGITPGQVHTEGIGGLTCADTAAARSLGYVIKLLAEFETTDGAVSARVGPTLLRPNHPLAQTRGAENAVMVESRYAGTLHLRGAGAGPAPTASAVLGDVLAVAAGAPSTALHRFGQWQSSPSRCRAMSSERRHLITLRGDRSMLTPERVFDILRVHDVKSHHIDFSVDGVSALTEQARGDRIGAVCQALCAIANCRAFAAPVLDGQADQAIS